MAFVSGIHHFPWFVLAAMALVLTPGQDTMFIIGRSLSGGLRAGLAAACGVTVGGIVHTVAAAFGLSVILATSAWAFTLVKVAGAAYLVYLGARLLLSKPVAADDARAGRSLAGGAAAGSAPRQAFVQGILTNVLNPKVALFFLAFLPQFIDAANGPQPLAFLLLGGTFLVLGAAWCCVLAAGASRLRHFFERHPRARTGMDRVVGLMFLGLGARLAWAR
jgi:threonine/homoserine/homoserine lactone efflux protein